MSSQFGKLAPVSQFRQLDSHRTPPLIPRESLKCGSAFEYQLDCGSKKKKKKNLVTSWA